MPYLLLIVMLIFSQAIPFFPCQTILNTISIGQDTSKPKEPLRLNLTIVNQICCVGDNEIDRVKLEVRLTFSNTGEKQLFLFKSKHPSVLRVLVSKSFKDAAAKQYIQDASITSYYGGEVTILEKEINQPEPSHNLFAYLASGESYETNTNISTFVLKDSSMPSARILNAGEYVLQVEVATWEFGESLSTRMRDKWNEKGILCNRSITSEPIQFKIEENRNIVDCK
jgi:hypothetical protein